MRGEKEKTICLWAAAALIFTAVFCRFLGMLFIHSYYMGLTRSAIYIFLYAAWAVSVRNRIIHVRIRRYLTAIAGRCSMPPPWAFRSPTRTIRSFVLRSGARILVQDKAEERRHTLCMASDDNAGLHQ